MPEENTNAQTIFPTIKIQRRTKILLALFAITMLASIQLTMSGQTPSVVNAGATLTPTVPMPADTEVPTATAFPPTSTPIAPTETPVPTDTQTPVPPTATSPPTTSGGGNNNPSPTPTPTVLPVEEIPELGVSNASSIILMFVMAFLGVMVWTGYTVIQATSSTKD